MISKRWVDSDGDSPDPAAELFRRAGRSAPEIRAETLIRARAALRRRLAAQQKRKQLWWSLPTALLLLLGGPVALAALLGDGVADWLVQAPVQVLRWARHASRAPKELPKVELEAPATPLEPAQAAPAEELLKVEVPAELAAPPPAAARPARSPAPPQAQAQTAPVDSAPSRRSSAPPEQWAVLDPKLQGPEEEPEAEAEPPDHAVVGREEQPAAPAPLPVPSPSPQPTPLESESALLSQALERLKKGRDPRGALLLLDEHDRRFVDGLLGQEAALARLGALLELKDRGRALTLLDRIARQEYAGSVRASELRVLHGELLSEQGRCKEAAAVFSQLLSGGGGQSGFQERALFGRSGCRARIGDFDGSRRDLQKYLRDYPQGRFAGAARSALGQDR